MDTKELGNNNNDKNVDRAQDDKIQNFLSGTVPNYNPKKDEVYMNTAQLEHFKKVLNLWKQDLLNNGDSIILELKANNEHITDVSDQATQEEVLSLKLKARDRESKLIRKINASIDAISKKEYGYCHECGVEIGVRRLEARPTATMCIDCKTVAEMREKHQH